MGLLEVSLVPSPVSGLPAGMPRKVLRRLIVGNGLGVGSRVLLAGGRAGELMPFFDRLGLSVSGFTETVLSPPESYALRRSFPGGRLGTGPAEPAATSDIPFDDACFDLVLACDLAAYAGSLFDRAAFHTTVNLLSCAKPGGRAIVLVRLADDGRAPGGHTASCFVRHLSHFSGELDVSHVPDGLVGVDPFAWIVGRRLRPGFLLAGLRLPAEPPSRFGWHEQAEAAAAARRDECCRIPAPARRSAA